MGIFSQVRHQGQVSIFTGKRFRVKVTADVIEEYGQVFDTYEVYNKRERMFQLFGDTISIDCRGINYYDFLDEHEVEVLEEL